MSMRNSINNQRTAVVGFGKTGKAVLDFLLEGLITSSQKDSQPQISTEENQGENLYLFNDTPIQDQELFIKQKYEKKGVIFLEGDDQFKRLQEVKLIILSPGVDGRSPRFNKLRKKGIKIISEIELASSFLPSYIPIIAVTGTNGKSTTVSLIHHILNSTGIKSFLTGNIGIPFISQVEKISRNSDSVVVVEVSSFQLEEIIHFRPHIGIILNITPDHLDRYASTAEYFAAKLNLVKNQERNDYLVLNADDQVLSKNALDKSDSFGPARRLWFSRAGDSTIHGDQDIFASLKGEEIHLHLGGFFETQQKVEKIALLKNPLRGLHNLENILAAVTTARLLGVSSESIETSITSFQGLAHRMESMGKVGNVEFINDSKATNVDAALKSITSILDPLVLILGGKDKGSDFTVLGNAIRERVEQVLLLGQAAPTIRSQFSTYKDLQKKFAQVSNLGEAVEKGYQCLKKKGGVVLLAPGCASFDMFNNFEHRGDVFKDEVLQLKARITGSVKDNAKESM